MHYDKTAKSFSGCNKAMFHPFSLKNNPKKWLYSISTDSTISWRIYDIISQKILSYPQDGKNTHGNQSILSSGEFFWKYLERFKDLTTQCSNYAIEKGQFC